MIVYLPTHEIMNNYKYKTKDIYRMISNNCFENKTLIGLRDTLLPKLMSGEINVSSIDL